MDVDDFKKVVDTYGHLKGSQTLQEMAPDHPGDPYRAGLRRGLRRG